MNLSELWTTICEAVGLPKFAIFGIITLALIIMGWISNLDTIAKNKHIEKILSFIPSKTIGPLMPSLVFALLVLFYLTLTYATDLRLKTEPKLLFDLTLVSPVDDRHDPHFRRPVYVGVKNTSSVTVTDVELTLKDYVFENLPTELKRTSAKLLKPMSENTSGSERKVSINPGDTKYFEIGEEGLDENNIYYFKYQPLRHRGIDKITLQATGANTQPLTSKFYIGYNVENPTPVDPSKGIAYDIYRSKAITFKPVEGYEAMVWGDPLDIKKR